MRIRIGGVPEHFNLPIHLAIEQKHFEQADIELEWITYKGGTGQMTKALREGEVDICILLTEGIIADIINGNPSKIISEYVTSPLIWGIHTGAENTLSDSKDIFTKQYAISRFGSGSHLMAVVHAHQNNQDISSSQFTVIKNLDGALHSLSTLSSDVFYWEKFTTKPYVDNGQLKRIGEYLTPWSCFVIAATDTILEKAPLEVHNILKIINFSNYQFMLSSSAVSQVSDRYDLDVEDAKEWYLNTTWATDNHIDSQMISTVIKALQSANILNENIEIPSLTWKFSL